MCKIVYVNITNYMIIKDSIHKKTAIGIDKGQFIF